ncbi:maltose/moltooligosaccharide transporter [Amaricoccus macauensis]|uniref:Maltose/moltooligosaccharide transporter n=1 Tax=Amaricoccus macauensis TaxID=57001 RepID=A0A840SHU7_9RHOB|nr:MFS transporter [Amaricoccus macauensis]MBB5220330.1 maltose/moltooligosaccharide transporter [Amaricoccus macauensis]
MTTATATADGDVHTTGHELTHTTIVRQKPLMDMRQILLMNLGFFGIQYSFGMQQTAINPIFQFIGADAHSLPILNLAGPMTGLLIQPMIGALSDRTWSPRWGRRKPFFLIGAVGCSVCLFLFPFVSAIWMAVLLLWLLDASNNTAMEPYRAFIADKLPPSQLGKGFLAQSFFTGFGITLANISLFVFQTMITGATEAGIPYWVVGSFMLGAVCSIGSVLVSVLTTPEIPPTEAELKALREHKGSALGFVREIWDAIVEMPVELRKLGLVYLFQWYAMMCYWQFVTLSMAKSVWGTTDAHSDGFREAVAWTGLINGWYNIVTFSVAFSLVAIARRRGAKFVHMACLLCAAAGLLIFPHLTNKYALFVPIIGLGIAWASIMGVPYIMAVRMIPSTRYGVYMGIINMMIVVPMLIHSFTFGWVYSNILGDNPNNAISFAGIGLGVAALAMLWIKEPPIVRDVDDVAAMPVGGH